MTSFIFANNVNTTLAGSISSSATSLTLSSSTGLPTSIPTGFVLVISLRDQATRQNTEIIYATSISGATLSGLSRGQEGTSALSWSTGDYAYSGVTAGQMANVSSGRLLGVPTVISASGTFDPNPASTLRRIYGSGGGAAGGGVAAASGGQAAVAPGGSAGAYGEIWVSGSMTPQTVTIGAAGVPGAVGANPGGAGGQSSFGAFLVLPGGIGGIAGGTGTPPSIAIPVNASNAPSTGGTGVEVVDLQRGGGGSLGLALNVSFVTGGTGGSNPLGAGGEGSSGGNGTGGSGYGAGGGGAGIGQGGAASQGGAGTQGVFVVEEYA